MIRPLRAYVPPFFLREALQKKTLSRGIETLGEAVGFSNPSKFSGLFQSQSENNVIFHIRYQSPFEGEGQMFGIHEMNCDDPLAQLLLAGGKLSAVRHLWSASNAVFDTCQPVRVKVLPGALVAITNIVSGQ